MSIQATFQISLFANLSYVRWDSLDTPTAATIAVASSEGAIAPANVVIQSLGPAAWSIPSYTESTSTGFAANVFASGTQKILAIRGTEPGDPGRALDLFQADLLELGLIGTSLSQAVSLFNYVTRLAAPAGTTDVRQFDLRVTDAPPDGLPSLATTLYRGREVLSDPRLVHYWLEPRFDGVGEGVLNAGDHVTVTGHSLGGHLAALALRLFPGIVDEAVLFNAANFDPVLAQFVPGAAIGLIEGLAPSSPLKPFVADGYSGAQQLTERLLNELFAAWLPGAPPLPDFAAAGSRLLNYVSEDSDPGDDLSLIAGPLTGRAAAAVQEIRTETNSHGMDPLMDSLAVQALVEELAPGLDLRTVAALIDAADATPAHSLESLVEALDRALHGSAAPLATTAAGALGYPDEATAPGTFERRAALHTRVLAIADTAEGVPGLALEPLVGLTAEALAARAEQSAAVRRALLDLTPFALHAGDSVPQDPAAVVRERFSPDALTDRAAYLAAELARRAQDAREEIHGPEPFDVRDLARDTSLRVTTVEVNPLGVSVDRLARRHLVFGTDDADVIEGGDQVDHLHGAAGPDVLRGHAGADVLDGDLADDVLWGGPGADRLWGGPGADTLFGGAPDLPDDGAADLLDGGAGHDLYHVARGDRVHDAAGDGELLLWREGVMHAAGAQPLAARFVSDDIAIYHAVPDPALWFVYLPRQRTLSVGGVTVDEFDDGDLGIVLHAPADPVGTRLRMEGTGGADHLVGTALDDELHALAGDDVLHGAAGDDVLLGGDGDDQLSGDDGNDLLRGDAGRDALFGRAGDDRLEGGRDADLLSGRDGHDVLTGGDGDDVLLGGSGHDVLLGGDGADFLAGSARAETAAPDWRLEFLPHPLGGVVRDPRNVRLHGVGGEARAEFNAPSDPDGDVLLGEGGRDYLLGSGGADWLDGGADDDVLAGGDGDDHLLGGAGDDHLRGGGGADIADGGEGHDVIVGHGGDESAYADGDDRLAGGAGDDRLHGGPGDDALAGDDGDDEMFGDEGRDILHGGAGRDRLLGGDDNDVLHGDAEADVLFGERGHDGLFGGDGADVLLGGQGNDALAGGADDDQLFGEDDRDALFGDTGADLLVGGNHDDVLQGGPGADRLLGGLGHDLYIYMRGDGVDELADAGGDNGLWLPDLDWRTLDVRETGSDLQITFADGGSIQVRDWRAPDRGVSHVRFAGDGYVSREGFLTDTAAGRDLRYTGTAEDAAATDGDDRITLAAPGGTVDAGAGHDRYLWDGTGAYVLADAQGRNVLQLGPAVALDAVDVRVADGRYVLGTADGAFAFAPGALDRFVFDGGLVLDALAFDQRYAALLDPAPRVLNPAGVQGAFVGTPFAYTLPMHQFVDL
ncbi:MAG: hypothetical protein AB7Q76_20285, partial [Gammaproteobacteria bacterium]